jgi:hypothetical protein
MPQTVMYGTKMLPQRQQSRLVPPRLAALLSSSYVPCSWTASVGLSNRSLRTLVVERHVVGGQAGASSLIRNYLGFPRGISVRNSPKEPTNRLGCSARNSYLHVR